MKKIRFCLAAAILALSLLSGCGMARDGYIQDVQTPSDLPVESPYLGVSPAPTKTPAGDMTTQNQTPKPETDMGGK